jgi:hypothetical protein
VLPEDGPSLTLDDALRCRIRVAGVLEPRWSDRLQGLRIATEAAGGRETTELSGELIDQAALMGVLMGLYNLGLPLLSVDCAPAARRRRTTSRGRPRDRPQGAPGTRAPRGAPRPRRRDREPERDG